MNDVNNWNITIKAGETLRETFKLKNDDGSPVKLTGATGVCQIRKNARSAEALASPSLTVIDADNGEMKVELAAAISRTLPTTGVSITQEDAWVWDAFITYSDGTVECLWDGEFRVRPRVTQNE
jgi:hypothetical protein